MAWGHELIDANITSDGPTAHISAGPYEFFVECSAIEAGDPQTFDFAVYGLAVLSMSAQMPIHIRQPVSSDTASQFEKLRRAFELWDIEGLAPLQLTFSDVVEPRPHSSQRKVVCVSGGIDSGYAAIKAKRDLGFTHALLIAGADYHHDGGPAFDELADRVGAICRFIGLELITLRTSIRTVPFNWEMLFTLNLGMCLNFLAPGFAAGGYALDYSGPQELYAFPWGNNRPLAALLSRPSFPIIHFGADEDRWEKLGAILNEGPGLADWLSVCWEDHMTGGNCGKCYKCSTTRLLFHSFGIDAPAAFPVRPPLEQLIGNWPLPTTAAHFKRAKVRTLELLAHLPDSPFRPDLLEFNRKLDASPFSRRH